MTQNRKRMFFLKAFSQKDIHNNEMLTVGSYAGHHQIQPQAGVIYTLPLTFSFG